MLAKLSLFSELILHGNKIFRRFPPARCNAVWPILCVSLHMPTLSWQDPGYYRTMPNITGYHANRHTFAIFAKIIQFCSPSQWTVSMYDNCTSTVYLRTEIHFKLQN